MFLYLFFKIKKKFLSSSVLICPIPGNEMPRRVCGFDVYLDRYYVIKVEGVD